MISSLDAAAVKYIGVSVAGFLPQFCQLLRQFILELYPWFEDVAKIML